MDRRRLGHGLVNTAVDNERALALYESVGFRRLADQLVVMQLDVTERDVTRCRAVVATIAGLTLAAAPAIGPAPRSRRPTCA